MKLGKKRLALIALVVALAIGNLVLAILYVTRDVDITGGVSTIGSIEVYQNDGVTVLTSFDFDNFTGGVSQTRLMPFFINNTGNQPLYVYWNISTSSIAWSQVVDTYHHTEEATHKYTFGIYNGTVDHWTPETEARILEVGQDISETFQLYYTGNPVTAETFSFTVTFYAKDA